VTLISALHFIGECPETARCNYIHKTFGLLSDGPHITAEAIVDAIEAIAIFTAGTALERRRSKRILAAEHRALDEEHGHKHE